MSVVPTTAAPNLPAVVAAAAGPVVVITQPPPDIQKLPPGTPLEAVVIERQVADKLAQAAAETDARQTLILRTNAGDVAVRTAVPLDDGARVALEVLRSSGGQVTARVVTIDDVPAKQALAQLSREAPSAAPAPELLDRTAALPGPRLQTIAPGQAWTPPGPIALTAVQPLSAFVIKAAPLPATAPATSMNSFLPGSDLAVRVVSVQLAPASPIASTQQNTMPVAGAAVASAEALAPKPATPNVLATPNAATANPNPGAVPTTATTSPVSPNPAGVAPISNTPRSVVMRGVGPMTPASTPPVPGALISNTTAVIPASPPELPGLKLAGPQGLPPSAPMPPKTVEAAPVVTRIAGQVGAASNNGALVVQTPMGELQLNVRANVPVGSTVTLEVLSVAPPRTDAAAPISSAPSPGPATLPLSTPTTGWTALSEAVQVLSRVDPQAATQLAAAIPDGGPRTAVATMAFVQAMRSGDARSWPGDSSLRALERAGPRGAQLAAQLSSEVKEMASRSAEPQGEWRTTPLPWNMDGKIERVNLITRREGDGDDDEAKKKGGGKGQGTRFLINLDLSRFGEMQLDGMFVKSNRAFDMMVRTKAALPDHVRRDLSGLFADSNAAMGLKGVLTFQVAKTFPDPTKGKAAADRGGVWA